MSDRSIKEAINKMVGQHKVDPVSYVDAVVNSVDMASRTCDCTVVLGMVEYDLPNVKLMPVVDDGFLIQPTVGSIVKIIFSLIVDPFICQYSEIDNIWINANQKITFNGGSNTTAKADILHTQLNKAKARIDDLIKAINSAAPDPSETGLISLKASVALITDSEDYSQIENKDILHGTV